MKVKLQDVVDTMDMLGDEMSGYLNKRTGELYTVNNEEIEAAEFEEEDAEDEELDEQPEWLRESIQKAREISESDDWLALPTKRDFHEYGIMEEFGRSLTDPRLSNTLLSAIKGSGAFRRFRSALDDLDLRQEWFGFRSAELEKIAVEWLEENQIEYTREAASGQAAN
ncbi:MAG TPA: UPF0158 family protein [Pyrinomonadaceae bacterium]|nr:UPF0158 family protein [Pyrinomonadaceae bacterium]